jgi:hypothetical protein
MRDSGRGEDSGWHRAGTAPGTGRAFRLIVTGGGSGGHTYPALATVRALRPRLAAVGRELVVIWAGTAGSLEERVARDELVAADVRAARARLASAQPGDLVLQPKHGLFRGLKVIDRQDNRYGATVARDRVVLSRCDIVHDGGKPNSGRTCTIRQAVLPGYAVGDRRGR